MIRDVAIQLSKDLLGNLPATGDVAMHWGVVSATHTSPNSLDVKLDGASTPTTRIRYLSSYSPAVNDVVVVLRLARSGGTGGLTPGLGADYLVLGKLA